MRKSLTFWILQGRIDSIFLHGLCWLVPKGKGNHMRRLAVTLGIVCLLLACASSTDAQTVQGVVVGTVFDASGAVLAGADVTLTNVGTNIAQATKTSNDGGYRFSLVPPGMYKLTVKASGFTEKQITDIKVDPSETVPIDRKS